jgi:two-component system, OmpR family, response regulator
MNRILLVDDDVALGELLKQYLATEGFSVDTALDGDSALRMARGGGYDLLILDVMMPRMNGLDVLRELRTQSLTPVLMLTARGDEVDSIVGLELGADDYLAKPCSPRVLVARVRAILRRAEGANGSGAKLGAPPTLTVGDLEIHPGTRRVYRTGEPVAMTSTEYSVLNVLVQEAGRVVPKANLCERALGRGLARYDRSLDMHVANLRKKLGPLAGGEERIKTVRGVGYQYTLA